MKRRLSEETGTTLVEVIIVVSLLSAVLAAALGSMTTFQSAANVADLRGQNTADARLVIDNLSRDIRTATRPASSFTAPPFTVAKPREMTFYANFDTTTGPTLTTVEIDEGRLRQTVVEPAGTAPNFFYEGTGAHAPETRLVGGHVDTTAPIFTYLDTAGNPIPQPTTGSFSLEQLQSIRSVRIELSVKQSADVPSVSATTVRTVVRLPNVAFNPTDGNS